MPTIAHGHFGKGLSKPAWYRLGPSQQLTQESTAIFLPSPDGHVACRLGEEDGHFAIPGGECSLMLDTNRHDLDHGRSRPAFHCLSDGLLLGIPRLDTPRGDCA